ncbi:MAG: aminotransferase class V-fold PLP-dependent enzyme, partial [Planctomycetes bacterium]|nr:aminotransferase class V-fold PLP-dependent enzyme [Planctomycetota bacterium]
MIYLNNAATSWPKPDVVYTTVDKCFREMDSPMRNASEGVLHGDLMTESRNVIAPFFGIRDPARLILTPGCTYALNLAILGVDWKSGDVAIMSGLEHHAVSRPIRKLAIERGVRFEVAPYEPGRPIDLDFVEQVLRRNRVRLVVCTMASNVTGDIFPVEEVVALAHRYDTLCLIDAAQASGILDVNVERIGADLLAFAGHKGLFGPPGLGGLYVAPGIDLRTLAEGGTGGDSGEHGMSHKVPSTYEVGTHNLPAIAGLSAGVQWIKETGLDQIQAHERKLAGCFIEGVSEIPGVKVYGTTDLDQRT